MFRQIAIPGDGSDGFYRPTAHPVGTVDESVQFAIRYQPNHSGRDADPPVDIELLFDEVLEYRFVDSAALYEDFEQHTQDFSFGLIEVLGSQYIDNMADKGVRRSKPGARFGVWRRAPRRWSGYREAEIRHYRLAFDDHGRYDIVCQWLWMTSASHGDPARCQPIEDRGALRAVWETWRGWEEGAYTPIVIDKPTSDGLMAAISSIPDSLSAVVSLDTGGRRLVVAGGEGTLTAVYAAATTELYDRVGDADREGFVTLFQAGLPLHVPARNVITPQHVERAVRTFLRSGAVDVTAGEWERHPRRERPLSAAWDLEGRGRAEG